MKRSTLLFTGLLAASAIHSAYLWRELQGQRQLVAELMSRGVKAPSEHTSFDASPPGASDADARLPPTSGELDPPQAVDPTQRFMADLQAINMRIEPMMSGVPPEHELLEDPEYRAARKTMIRVLEAQMNPGLDEALGLGQTEAARLFDEMAESSLNAVEELSRNRGGSNPAAMMQSMERHSVNQEQAVRRLLGDSRYGQLQDYRRNLRPALQQIAEIRTELAAAGQPLTDYQARGLAAAIQNDSQRSRDQASAAQVLTESSAAGLSGAQGLERLDQYRRAVRNQVLATAGPHLTPAQLAVLRKQQE